MIRLKELRLDAGLSQKELAVKFGTTQRNISNWESGHNEPDIEMLKKIAKFFEVSTDYLLDIDFGADKLLPPFSEETLLNTVKRLPKNKKRALLVLLQDF